MHFGLAGFAHDRRRVIAGRAERLDQALEDRFRGFEVGTADQFGSLNRCGDQMGPRMVVPEDVPRHFGHGLSLKRPASEERAGLAGSLECRPGGLSGTHNENDARSRRLLLSRPWESAQRSLLTSSKCDRMVSSSCWANCLMRASSPPVA